MYEKDIWHYLTHVFRFRLKAAEIGITNDLIFRITSFYRRGPTSCEVYAFNDNINESKRGADIDLFIEDNIGSGSYHFFMLQAKIMDFNGKYKDIKRWSSYSQFNKLIRSANIEGAFPLYLFYNGSTPNSNVGNTNWGLSIVEANYIKIIRLSQRGMPRAPKITFNQIHPNMRPFHVLFCNLPTGYELPKTIIGNDIYKGYPYIKRAESSDQNISDNSEFENGIDEQTLDIIKNYHLAPLRIILNADKDNQK
jgi:hypothetical protein